MGNLKHTIKTAAVSSVITASAVLSVCGIALGSSADAQNVFNTDVNGDGKTDVMDFNIVKNVVLNNENNGTAVTEGEDFDCVKKYTAVLDYYYQAYNDTIELNEFGSNWLTPRISENKAENFEKTGYAFRDLNGDGTPELIIGEIEDTSDNTGIVPGVVYSYSKEKNEITEVFESWDRNINILLSDNSIVNTGSNGVSSSVLGHFVLEPETCSKKYKSFVFSELKDDKVVYYTNTTGEYDPEKSETIESYDFEKAADELLASKAKIEFNPLSEYKQSRPLNAAAFSDDIKASAAFRLFEDSGRNTVFTATEDISSVVLYDITDIKLSDEGSIVEYTSVPVYKVPELKAGESLVAGLEYGDVLPCNSICFVDKNGVMRSFVITQSGQDGSVILTEA